MVGGMSSSAPANRPLAGALWMLAAGLCFVGVNAGVKHVGPDIPAAQSAFVRYALGLVFLLPVLPALRAAPLTQGDVTLFATRGAVHTLGVILWFHAMIHIPLAEVTAMGYLSPVYITIGAALFLGERFALRRALAVAAALAGALMVLRPGFREISEGHVAMLGNAVMFATSYLIAKRMTDRTSPTVVVAMLSITVAIGLAPFAAAVWVPITLPQVGWLFLVAAFATAGHYAMSLAFGAAPITVTQPVTFLQLLWATLLGALAFGEPADGWVIAGGVTIMGAVSFITWREAVLRRRAITPPVEAIKL
jgi:drug/metabolite transporter (DMT)-like permease